MKQEELNEVLRLHKLWLRGAESGKRADLQDADMQIADMRGADMRGADMRGADMLGANIRYADMRGANVDYSCWPLWCGSLDAKVDRRIAAQLAYHFCRLDCDDPGYIEARNAIVNFANEFHRAEECGKLKKKKFVKRG